MCWKDTTTPEALLLVSGQVMKWQERIFDIIKRSEQYAKQIKAIEVLDQRRMLPVEWLRAC